MQERKRLEQSVADEQRIATMASDLDTLFELAREGEDVTGDIAREMKSFSELLERWKLRCCCRAERRAQRIVTIHPAPAVRKARTGPRCCCACICDGPSSRASTRHHADRLEGEGAGIKSVRSK
jgi:hypothetical protein